MNTSKVTYTISIAVYDNLKETRKCIDGLITSLSDVHYEIIIIDNNSSIETAEYLASICRGNITVITNDSNEGFIAAHNKSLAYAEGEFFLVLNNDIEILSKTSSWIESMRREFDKEKVQVVGVSEMCGYLNHLGEGYSPNNIDREIDYVEGSCLMVRTSFVREHGLFSTDYIFGYCEDSDLSLRVREMGYKISAIHLPIFHSQFATGKRVAKLIDLEGYMILNHITLRNRWKHYLMYHNFNYRVLIRRNGGWGDVLLITPIIEELKRRNPNLIIDVETSCPDILANNPHINKLLTTNSGQSSYNTIYNLNMAYEKSPRKHIIDAYTEECSLGSLSDVFPKIYIGDEHDNYANQLIDSKVPSCIIHFDTDVNWVGRTLSRVIQADILQALALKNSDINFYIINGDDYAKELYTECTNIIQLPSLTTMQLCSVISKVVYFVGIDSFPFHIAQTFDKFCAVAFGAIDPTYRIYSNYVLPISNEWLNCLGCHHYLSSPRVVTTTCSREPSAKIAKCMSTLSVEDFINAFEELKKVVILKSLTAGKEKINNE